MFIATARRFISVHLITVLCGELMHKKKKKTTRNKTKLSILGKKAWRDWWFNAKSVTVSHPCTALFHNRYEIAERNEKMASSEPSATLLHICSVWKEQKPHEVQAAFQVESAILRVKDVNVWESASFRKAPSRPTEAGPRVLIVTVPPLKQRDTELLNTWPVHDSSLLDCIVSECSRSCIFLFS